MKIHTYASEQLLPGIALGEAWAFFATPLNLNRITPPHLHFEILSKDAGQPMFKGQIIRYKVQPLPLYRTTWVTEIAEVNPMVSFVDVQKQGPFAHWHHTHLFFQEQSGVKMYDNLQYTIPFGRAGQVVGPFIHRKVTEISSYRRLKLEEIFPVRK